jgi:hypothetical protein
MKGSRLLMSTYSILCCSLLPLFTVMELVLASAFRSVLVFPPVSRLTPAY